MVCQTPPIVTTIVPTRRQDQFSCRRVGTIGRIFCWTTERSHKNDATGRVTFSRYCESKSNSCGNEPSFVRGMGTNFCKYWRTTTSSSVCFLHFLHVSVNSAVSSLSFLSCWTRTLHQYNSARCFGNSEVDTVIIGPELFGVLKSGPRRIFKPTIASVSVRNVNLEIRPSCTVL